MRRLAILGFPLLVILTLLSSALFPLEQAAAAGPAEKQSAVSASVQSTNNIPAPPAAQKGKHPKLSLTPGEQQKTLGSGSNASGGGGNVFRHGGPVELTPKIYTIFWGASWNNGSGQLSPDGVLIATEQEKMIRGCVQSLTSVVVPVASP